MQESSAVGRIVDLVRDLRSRCPWDAAQTPQTLRPYLMEEVFELDHALSGDDPGSIRVELGDLLLHLAFQIVLAEERGQFGPEDLTRQVEQKMWRRHPHLYPTQPVPPGIGGEGSAAGRETASGREVTGVAGTTAHPPSLTADQVKANWEKLKLRERGH
jgi:NTP pyrophosphatase (non-canonical NTP hydrolase)